MHGPSDWLLVWHPVLDILPWILRQLSGCYSLVCISFQVLGGQARSQFSQFPPYGLSQGLGQASAFSQQSVYLQTAPHPPPTAAPDMYQSTISQFRIQVSVYYCIIVLLYILLLDSTNWPCCLRKSSDIAPAGKLKNLNELS